MKNRNEIVAVIIMKGSEMEHKNIRQKVEKEILNSYESLYRIAFSYVKNKEDSLDIVQESIYKAIRSAQKVENEKYIKTWICRIVINTSIDFIEKRKKELPADYIEDKRMMEDKYRDMDLYDALKILNERERTIVILKYFEEWKLEEIADGMGENISTVKSVLYRSLRKLKIEIMEGGNGR